MAKSKPNQGLAIAALIINLIILPDLGSIIGGKTSQGIWQIVLFVGGLLIGFMLTLTIIGALIGIPLMVIAPIAAWIWALVTGIQIVKESS